MPSKKPRPEDPFAALWESEIPEILRRDTNSQVTNAGLLDTLLQRHPRLLDSRNRNHMLRTLGRQVARWSTRNGHEPRECIHSEITGREHDLAVSVAG